MYKTLSGHKFLFRWDTRLAKGVQDHIVSISLVFKKQQLGANGQRHIGKNRRGGNVYLWPYKDEGCRGPARKWPQPTGRKSSLSSKAIQSNPGRTQQQTVNSRAILASNKPLNHARKMGHPE